MIFMPQAEFTSGILQNENRKKKMAGSVGTSPSPPRTSEWHVGWSTYRNQLVLCILRTECNISQPQAPAIGHLPPDSGPLLALAQKLSSAQGDLSSRAETTRDPQKKYGGGIGDTS